MIKNIFKKTGHNVILIQKVVKYQNQQKEDGNEKNYYWKYSCGCFGS